MKGIAEVSDDKEQRSGKKLDHYMVTDWSIRGDQYLMAACVPYLRSGNVTDEAVRMLWQHVVKNSEAESLLIDREWQRAAQTDSPRWTTVAANAHNGSELERLALLMHHLHRNDDRPPHSLLSRCKGMLRPIIEFLNTPLCIALKRS